MFSRKVPNSVLTTKPNLKNVILTKSCHKDYFFRYNLTEREVTLNDVFKNLCEMKDKMKYSIQNGAVLKGLHDTFITIPRTFKNHSGGILKVWAHQCECVFAQRLRRGQQMFCHYTRLWEERALRELLNKFRVQITKHGKELVFGAVGVSCYNWDSNRISDADIQKYMNDMDYISLLSEKTIACDSCKVDQPELYKRNKTICDCQNKDNIPREYDNWVAFLEQKDMVVWRRLQESGCYEYKVYGSFDDVTAEDFLNVQIDSDYRKHWDKTAIALEVIEKDPCPKSNSDIIYWEMLWPKLFVNRDYVYNRRFKIDVKHKKIVIVSRGTTHPSCPVKPDKFRVDDYWSYMVVQPYQDLNKPGIEFGLTYYDNPGVNIPAAVTSWVALRAMPDFLMNLREATRHYNAYCENQARQRIFNIHDDIPNDCSSEEDEIEVIIDNTVFEPEHTIIKGITKSPLNETSKKPPLNETSKKPPLNETSKKPQDNEPTAIVKNSTIPKQPPSTNASGTEVLLSPSSTMKAESNCRSYWKYLHLNYYFS